LLSTERKLENCCCWRHRSGIAHQTSARWQTSAFVTQ